MVNFEDIVDDSLSSFYLKPQYFSLTRLYSTAQSSTDPYETTYYTPGTSDEQLMKDSLAGKRGSLS